MNKNKLNEVDYELNAVKRVVVNLLPIYLQDEFDKDSYISGGCIYSLYNDKDPKDYDFFLTNEEIAEKIRAFYMSLVVEQEGRLTPKTIYIVYYKGERVVITKNAISIGEKYQIITKFTGEPEKVVEQFDFLHNSYWYKDGVISALSGFEHLDSDKLVYNEKRARDISGTIIRVNRFVRRGMTITNSEMSKMLRKLRDVGFTDRENEIIDNDGYVY